MPTLLRRLAIAAIVMIFMLIAAMFAYSNQEPIAIDIGLVRLEEVSLAVMLVCTFAAGAVFGALCAGLGMLKMVNERRHLKRERRLADAELARVRSLPRHDAN